ncbi:flavodoxin domain-containing protein [Poritiphilus flavus]|uniref:Flavodoxin domain-containing protein n=1 Tax=Poritiphilus flavus TaxID=2697053 RepID=A0A6L9EI11_9FLAO|nr:flavodoxin domain-containing protein [Poritiphilus flavus]NAS14434.1 hypothetical protein [Poritiphilus flavus]
MRGAIFYQSKYGSTKQYARWIAEATGLPMFNVKDRNYDPDLYDYFIIGSPILYFKLSIRKWIKKYLPQINTKPVIFFSVSGAPAGEKLNEWIANSLPESFISKMHHVALKGRQIRSKLSWFDRMMLFIGSKFNKDPEASKEELEGFDYMDKKSINPILELVEQFKAA